MTVYVPHWVPHHIDGVIEPLSVDGPADGGTEFLQQHQRLEALGGAVGHDPATVAGAEGETSLETSSQGHHHSSTTHTALQHRSGGAPQSSISLSIYKSISLSIYLSLYISTIYLSISLYPSIYLLSISPSIYISIYYLSIQSLRALQSRAAEAPPTDCALPCSSACSTSGSQEDSQVSVQSEGGKENHAAGLLRFHVRSLCSRCFYLCDGQKLMSILEAFGESGVVLSSRLFE